MKKFIAFSFDDGTTQDIRLTALLKKYSFSATFNLNTGLLGETTDLSSLGIKAQHIRLTKAEIESGIYDGFETAVHTLCHPLLTALSDDEVISQINGDAQNIFSLTGVHPKGMAYPGGGEDSFDDRIISLIKSKTSIKYARIGQTTGNFDFPKDPLRWKGTCTVTDGRLLTLGRKFLQKKQGLFLIWGHSFELDMGDGWNRFEEFLKLMDSDKDACRASCGQVYDYLTVRASEQFLQFNG